MRLLTRYTPKLVAILLASTACSGSEAPKTNPQQPTAAMPLTFGPPSQKVTKVQTLFVASDEAPKAPAVERTAPWSLTASDGSGLMLTKVDARAVVEGPLAFTELHLYFHNPEARTREGTFAITLPSGAAVSRFAMETDGRLVEAEVVEKQLARRVYDDFLHRKQDPALLEKAAGNQFSARVFPIPAKGDKHIVLSFSQEVTPGRYTLPLRGLARSEAVDVRVQVRGKDGDLLEQTFAQRNWEADRDIVVDATKVAASVPSSIIAGEYVAARVPIVLQDGVAAPSAVTILVDTSASRALGFAASAKEIETLVAELARDYGGALAVQVVAFDQSTASIYDGRADAMTGVAAALEKRGALGASDLGQALAWIGDHGAKARVLIVTDGVITAGVEADKLKDAAKLLAGKGVDRIDVALAGGIRDEAAATTLTQAGLPHTGAVLDLERGTTDVARRVGLAVGTQLAVAVSGASWVFPRTIAAAQNGDEVTVFARRDPQGRGGMTLDIAGSKTALAPVSVTPALLDRAVANAQIAEMEARLTGLTGDPAKALKAEIVKLSIASRVVSSETSMLVLENDSDYARYGIDRTSLADILTVGEHGAELAHRVPAQIATPEPAKPMPPRKAPMMYKPSVKGKVALGLDDLEKSIDREESKVVKGVKDSNEDVSDKLAETKPDPSPRDQDPSSGASAGSGSSMAPGMAPPPPPPSVNSPSPSPDAVTTMRPPSAEPRISRARYDRSNSDGDYADQNENDDGMAANRNKPSLTGPLAEIEGLLRARNVDAALAQARAWHAKEPGDVLALIGLGDSLEAAKDLDTAARVYGSIIDLFPARADFRRFAGERLAKIGATQRALAIDTYKRAVAERPDHLTGHRLLAYALVRDGQYSEAFDAILAAIDQPYRGDSYAGGERVLAEDAGMIGAAFLAHGGKKDAITAALAKRDTKLATSASTRFIMYWETDANDVDFHIRDARGGHAWYSHKDLRSGGSLYADITTGYGPECFAIPGQPTAGPYELSINYYSQGPMGYGMGLLEIQKFDGKGGLTFEDRPYVIMVDQAFVDLGTYKP